MSEKPTILIIDDDPSIVEAIDILLSSKGYEILKARDGEEGIEMTKKHLPDVILLDVMMPKLSGYAVASYLNHDPKLKNIPKILLTGTAQIAGHITIESPTNYKLSKPFNPDELIALIQKILSPQPHG